MSGNTRKNRILKHAANTAGVDLDILDNALDCLRAMEEFKFNLTRHLNRFGISKSRFFVLSALYYEPEHRLTPAELAERIVLTRASMTACLDGLEKRGHIERTPHPTDRRMTLIRLTDTGQAYIEGHLPDHYLVFCRIFTALTPDEGRAMVESIRKLRDNIPDLPERP